MEGREGRGGRNEPRNGGGKNEGRNKRREIEAKAEIGEEIE